MNNEAIDKENASLMQIAAKSQREVESMEKQLEDLKKQLEERKREIPDLEREVSECKKIASVWRRRRDWRWRAWNPNCMYCPLQTS